MPKVTSAYTKGLLAASRYQVYDIVEIRADFTAPYVNGNGFISMTNYPVDIDLGGGDVTYSLGAFLGVSDIEETKDLEVSRMSITLSGLPMQDKNGDSFLSILLNEQWKDQYVKVYKYVVNPNSSSEGDNRFISVFEGYTSTANYESDPDNGTCTVTVSVESHFASFQNISGRRNNPSESGSVASKLYKTTMPTWNLAAAYDNFSTWELTGVTREFGSASWVTNTFGHQDASTFRETATTGNHRIRSASVGSLAAGQPITFSIFVYNEDDTRFNVLTRSSVSLGTHTTETAFATRPIFNLETGSVSTANAEYTNRGLVRNVQPMLNRRWTLCYITYTPTINVTNLRFILAFNNVASYTGDTRYIIAASNPAIYLGQYDENRSRWMNDYYDYIPDQMFKNSALTNLRVRWVSK